LLIPTQYHLLTARSCLDIISFVAECIYRSIENKSEPTCALLGGKDIRVCRLPTFIDEECPVALFKLRQGMGFDEANKQLVRYGAPPLVDPLKLRTQQSRESNMLKIIETVMEKYGPYTP